MKTVCQERFLPKRRTPPQVRATFVLKTHLNLMSTITKDGRCIIIHHTSSYWTDTSSKSYTRKEIVGNLIWSLQVWWEDHKGSELLSFWIDHIFNPHVSFVAICAPFLIFGFVTYEESQGRIFFLRWDFLMTSAVSLTDSFLFTVTAPRLRFSISGSVYCAHTAFSLPSVIFARSNSETAKIEGV